MKKIRICAVFCCMLLLALVLSGCACEHEYGEWTVVKEATCTEDGVKSQTCTKCNETQEAALAKIEHSFGDWEITKDSTCAEVGQETKTCSACGAAEQREITTLKDHTFGDWALTKAATCAETGVQSRTCSVCNHKEEQEVAKLEHAYGDWQTTKTATCTEAGTRVKTCSGCGAKIEEDISIIDHTYDDWKVTKAATCTEAGTKVKTCSGCGAKIEETIAAEHNWKDATCTKAKTCSVCGETTGKAKGHNWKDATCTKPKTCRTCGETDGTALGHNPGSNAKCTRCGEDVSIDMDLRVGHPDECETTKYFGFCFYKNSVDGIKLCWGGENLSGKTINYYTITIYFYNSVGDPAYDEITGERYKTVKYVGPVAPGEDLIIYGIVGYVPACSKVVVGDITLEYEDGTIETGWYGWSTTRRSSAIK